MSTLYQAADDILVDVCEYLSKDCGFNHTDEPEGQSLHDLAVKAMDHRSTTKAMHLALWETLPRLVQPDDTTKLTPFHHAINNGNQRLLLALLVKLCSHLLPRGDEKRKPISGKTATNDPKVRPSPTPQSPVPPSPTIARIMPRPDQHPISDYVCIRSAQTKVPHRAPSPSPKPKIEAEEKDDDVVISVPPPPPLPIATSPALEQVGKKRGRYAKKQCKGAEDCNKGANRECYHDMCLAHCKVAQASTGKACSISSHRKEITTSPAPTPTPSIAEKPPKKKLRTIAMSEEEEEEAEEKRPRPFGASAFMDLEAEEKDASSDEDEDEDDEGPKSDEEEEEEEESEDEEPGTCCHKGSAGACTKEVEKACYYFRCEAHCVLFQKLHPNADGECQIHFV